MRKNYFKESVTTELVSRKTQEGVLQTEEKHKPIQKAWERVNHGAEVVAPEYMLLFHRIGLCFLGPMSIITSHQEQKRNKKKKTYVQYTKLEKLKEMGDFLHAVTYRS